VDKETQEYYDTYFSLFASDGWKQLVSDFGNNVLQINSVEAAKDSDDLFFRKGQLNILGHLLNLQTIVENNYEEANKEDD
jgi:hypothetical protein